MKRKTLSPVTPLTTNPWRKLLTLCSTVSILGGLITACNTGVNSQESIHAQQDPLAQTVIQPNVQFNVQRQSGNCPETVELWMFMQGFEGGADHTIVAETQAIASAPVKLAVSEKKRREYEAPLKSEYATCVGESRSDLVRAYNFQFRDGKVRFRMDLSWFDGYSEILYKGISASRPYIHWRAAE